MNLPKYTILLCLLLLCLSCNKEPISQTTSSDESRTFYNHKWKVIWQKKLTDDPRGFITNHPIIHNHGVLFSTRFVTNGAPLYFLDQEDGAEIWTQQDLRVDIASHSGIIKHDNQAIIAGVFNTYSLDLQNGDLTNIGSFNYGFPRIFQAFDQIFYPHSDDGAPGWDTCFLATTPIDVPDWQPVLELYTEAENPYVKAIESLIGWVNNKNEQVLIFQNRHFNFDTLDGKVNLCAYNLTTGEMDWVIEDITPTGNSSIHLNLIHNDKVYFTGARTISCIDLNTREIVWQTAPGSSFASCAPIIVENKLIANGDNEDIYALDLENGTKIWEDKNSGATVNNMAYYHGHIYFASTGDGKLRCVRVADGQQIWAEDSPNEAWNSDVGFHQGISIDAEKGVLFTADGYYAMAIQLEE